jgi:hypothetical protein
MKPLRITSPGFPQGRAAARTVANPAALANRIAGGRRANRTGDSFEKVIFRSVEDSAGKVIELEDLPKCGARFTGKNTAHHLPICCDFIGAVIGPGDGIFFDAKSVGPEAYGIALNDEKIVKDHQAAFLHRMAGAGAIAGILVECRKLGDYRWLDGRHLGRDRAYTAWHDDRWIILGSMLRRVEFRTLVKCYLGEQLKN